MGGALSLTSEGTEQALPYEQLSSSRRRRLVLRSAIRAGATALLLVTIYYLVPMDHITDAWALTGLMIGLAVVGGAMALQVRAIIHSPYPRLRAVEAVFFAIPFYTLLFAAAYVVMSGVSDANFSESLSRTDALYFSVTIVTTVGFGDITAKTDVARLLVAAQMFGDLILLGLGLKLLLGATQLGQQRHAVVADQPADETHDGTFM